MNDQERMGRKARQARTALGKCGVLGLGLAAAVSLRAQEVAATNSPPAKDNTAYLEYQDASYSYSFPIHPQPFCRERRPEDKIKESCRQPAGSYPFGFMDI